MIFDQFLRFNISDLARPTGLHLNMDTNKYQPISISILILKSISLILPDPPACILTSVFSFQTKSKSSDLHPLLVGDNADQLGGELLDLVLLLARVLLQHSVLLEESEIPDQRSDSSRKYVSLPILSFFLLSIIKSHQPVLQLLSWQLVNKPPLLKKSSIRLCCQVDLQPLTLGVKMSKCPT